jgi:hypothetical protein
MSISHRERDAIAALQAAPATKARGYWATVGRRIVRDKVSMVCAFILLLIFLSALSRHGSGSPIPIRAR